MSKSLKIIWTENAVQDLLVIKDFISQDSVEVATSWLLELINAGESLSVMANRGRIVPEFNQENLRELIVENYRLVYRTKPTVIEILTIFEGHRQFRKKDIKK